MPLVVTDKAGFAEYRKRRDILNTQIERVIMDIERLRRQLRRRTCAERALERKYRKTHFYTSNRAGGR